MVLFNYSTRELTAKIVYYGPGLCGKTTNLQYIHANLPDGVKGRMLSLATKTDRTLFFDFLPIDLGEIRGMKTRVQLYTVPGQVFYNETRKLVLKGADGIVFVADSQEPMIGANVESFRNLEENLRGHGLRLQDMPHVIQFNKRDLPRLASIEDLNSSINRYNAPFYESVATTGIGVQDTLKAVVKLVLLHLTRKYETKTDPRVSARERAPQPVAPVAPAAQRPMPAPARPTAAAPQRAPFVDRERSAPPPRVAPDVVPAAAAGVQSIPVSGFDTPLSRPTAIPLSPEFDTPATETPRRPVPPPPDFRGRKDPAAASEASGLSFDADEIEDLMDEVDDFQEPALQADDVDWLPPRPEAVEPAPVAWRPAAQAPVPVVAPRAAQPPAPAPPVQATPPVPREDEWIPEVPIAVEPGPRWEQPIEIVEEEQGEATAWQPAPAAAREPQFEVDLGFDPSWQQESEPEEIEPAETLPAATETPEALEASEIVLEEIEPAPPFEPPLSLPEEDELAEEPVAELDEATPIPVRHTNEPADALDDGTVVLEEIAGREELFEDPDLEIARLASGDSKEIVVPVEIVEGTTVRRFKLSLRLRLDPLD
jgi:mutual gliding-motility protein MglA